MPTLRKKLSAEREDLIAEQAELLASGVETEEDQERDDKIALRIRDIDLALAKIEEKNGENVKRWMNTAMPQVPGQETYPATLPNVSPKAKTFVGKLFGKQPLSMGGWSSGDEYFDAIRRGSGDSRLQLSATQTIISDPAGGFSVPSQLVAGMLSAAYEESVVLNNGASVEPMESNTKLTWGFDSLSASGGTLFGGLTPAWSVETGTLSSQTSALYQHRLTAKKLALYCEASNELVKDGLNFAEMLQEAMIKSLSWAMDDAFLNGSGVGEPTGVLNDPALIAVSKVGSQTADTIKYANLTSMFSRLHPALVKGAVWVCNPSTLPELLALTIDVGSGGSSYPVLNETDGRLTILSLPLVLSEKLPTLGDQGDILLANFSQFAVGIRTDMELAKSQHVGFATDVETYRAIARVDGLGRWKSAYTPKAGSTLSWCVVTEARA